MANEDILGQEYLLDKKEEDKRVESNCYADFIGLSEEEANKKLVSYFREVFGTYKGQIVLGVLLEDLYYFNSTPSERTAALSDYAKTLIRERLGINDTRKQVEALFSIN